MTKLRIKLPAVLLLATLSFAFLVSFGFLNEAKAICTNKCQTGYLACLDYCSAHNANFTPGLAKCANRCQKYSGFRKKPAVHRKAGPAQFTAPQS